MEYASLHNHTHYSNIRLLDSINTVSDLFNRAMELGISTIALTDHECLSGHIEAIQEAKKLSKINEKRPKLILGNEIYLCRNGLNKENFIRGTDKYYHYILLAKDEIGHKQLRELSSRAWSHYYRQYIERVPTYYRDLEEIIGKDPGHIVASSACLGGQIPTYVLSALNDMKNWEAMPQLDKFIRWNKNLFNHDFYIEIQPGTSEDQIKFNPIAIEIAEKYGLKYIVTTDTHYLKKEDRPNHKAFLNSKDGDREVDDFYATTYMMGSKEISDYLIAGGLTQKQCDIAFNNTLEIAEKCVEYDLAAKPIIPKIKVTAIKNRHSLESYKNNYEYIYLMLTSPYPEDITLINKVLDSLDTKKDKLNEKYLDRIDEECKTLWMVSEKLGDRISNYFLTVEKVVDIAWTDGDSFVGPGRGSAGSWLTTYLLGITQYDPLLAPLPHPPWRFLSPERPELPDIDIDLQASKRERIIEAIRKYFENELGGHVVSVATFSTASSKAAIKVAARGLGIDVETANYLSSLVPVTRGFVWPLEDCMEGNEEEGRSPVAKFRKLMTEDYSRVYEVAKKIQGLICARGTHASGILITNESFELHNAMMRTSSGEVISQFDLHNSEYVSNVKFDLLTVNALDRTRTTMDLAIKYGYMDWQGSIKSTYEKYLHPDVLEYDDPRMWEMLANNQVYNIFQFDTQVAIDAINKIKPQSWKELSQANSLLRLMPERGKKTPIEEFVEYRKQPDKLIDEINKLKASEKEKKALLSHLIPLSGVADSQESVMLLTMDEGLTNFGEKEAQKLRKGIGKKDKKVQEDVKQFFFESAEKQQLSKDISNYIWNTIIGRQLGYAFSSIHTSSYSLVAIQELNLAFKYPIILWNCANLIVDSGGIDNDSVYNFEIEDLISNGCSEEDQESEVETEGEDSVTIKNKTVDYGRISKAIGRMRKVGITVRCPDINKSGFTFEPDIESNSILFGIKGITKINGEIAQEIIDNRPYTSMEDFKERVKVNTPQIINLVKSGCFDSFNPDRKMVLESVLIPISKIKTEINLRNVQMLLRYDVFPKDLVFQRQLYNFNSYLKDFKDGEYFILDQKALSFFERKFSPDILESKNGKILLNQKEWKKIYDKNIKPLKERLKTDNSILNELNDALIEEVVQKYGSGNKSKWEMDSINFYSDMHELSYIDKNLYGISMFSGLPEVPEIERIIKTKNGRSIPVFKTYRIMGTVIGKNKMRRTITLLCEDDVIEVRLFEDQFARFDRTIFNKKPDGSKYIVEESWFKRGTKLFINGYRRENEFIPKTDGKNKDYLKRIDTINDQTGKISLTDGSNRRT